MANDRRRFDLRLSGLSMLAGAASAIACGVISAAKLENVDLAYAMGAFGVAAGLAQWRFRQGIAAREAPGARINLVTELYGMFLFTAVCSVPGVLIGRALARVDIWTGS